MKLEFSIFFLKIFPLTRFYRSLATNIKSLGINCVVGLQTSIELLFLSFLVGIIKVKNLKIGRSQKFILAKFFSQPFSKVNPRET